MMHSEKFESVVLPQVRAAWTKKCLCRNPGFRKLVSFRFEDYGPDPMQLVDALVIWHNLIKFGPMHFQRHRDSCRSSTGDLIQRHKCLQCGSTCEETYSEHGVSIVKTCFCFLDDRPVASIGLYLVGFESFAADSASKVLDFREAGNVHEFLQSNGAEQCGEPEPPITRVMKS